MPRKKKETLKEIEKKEVKLEKSVQKRILKFRDS